MKVSLFLRAVLSLAALSGSYWVYALYAVPLIEPTLHAEELVDSKNYELLNARPADRYRHLLEPLFPPGSWELKDPLVLRNTETMLLLDGYQILEDRRNLKLKSCTLIFNPKGLEASGSAAPESSADDPLVIVMQAPEGALLKFDQPFDLRSGRIGQIEAGQLLGKVHIYNPLAGAAVKNKLDIVTSDVQLRADRIWTPSDVDFQIGPAVGQGRDLAFHLQSEDDSPLRRLRRSTEMQIRAVELVHLERLRVQLPPDWFGQSKSAGPSGSQPGDVAIEVKCDGPMKLDINAGLATVEKNVVLRRPRADGEDDHVYCQVLSLHFDVPDTPAKPEAPFVPDAHAVPDADAAIANSSGTSWGVDEMPTFQLNRIVALGHPAVASLSARSVNEMRGTAGHPNAAAVDLQTNELLRGRYHAEAVRFDYRRATAGGLGTFRAHGPGKFRSTENQEGTGYLEVVWSKELSITPDGDFHLLSLVGNGRINAERLGKLRADLLNVWLRDGRDQQPPLGLQRTTGIYPDRAQAEGGVTVESQQLSGSTDLLKVWFKYSLDEEASQTGSPSELGLTLADGAGGVSADNALTTGLHVQGDELRILVDARRDAIELEEVTLKGRVQCVETNVSAAEQQPLQMSGELFRLRHLTARGGTAKIEGFPARIQARGISLSGAKIEMDREANRLWIDGAGTARLPLPDELAARYSRRETSAAVTWSGGFDFDGQQIQCTREVEIRGPAQSIQTDELALTLTQPVQLSDLQAPLEDVGVEQITAKGNVRLENHSFDERGLVTIDKMFVRDLTVNQLTGEIAGQGPGWVNTMREGGRRLVPLGRKEAADDSQVTLLHVDFQRGLGGNLHRRELSFFGQVKAVYGSADDWQSLSGNTTRQSLPEGGVILRCQELKVVQMAGRHAVIDAPVEMIATGNTTVEGRTFSARAHRISYAQAKGQLVIEGDGRTDAELWHQASPAAPEANTTGRKIQFWPETNRIIGGDWKSIDLKL